METQRQRQVRELEQSYKQDQIHAEKIHDKKVDISSITDMTAVNAA